jgi:hypothetical protein
LLAAPAEAEIITDWAEVAGAIRESDRTPWTVERQFIEVRLGLAMFEAANAIDRKYRSHLGIDVAAKGASIEAAVMTAAREVLVKYYPERSQEIDGSYQVSLAMIVDAAAKQAGVAIGMKAAAAAIAMPDSREGITFVRYRPVTTPGQWVPVQLPAFDDQLASVATLSFADFEEMMPPPPPSLTSDVWARDLNEVKLIGGRKSSARTPVQSLNASYRITPDLIPILRSITVRPGRSTVDNARLYALVSIADSDITVVTGLAKVRYNFWRPITAIRNADQDGNPATTIDPDWRSFIITPNHPEYPCLHCSWTAGVAEVFKAEVGNAPEGGVQVGSQSLDFAVTQTLPTFDRWVEEVSYSRILGGVHYRFSNDAGEALGRRVAMRTLTLLPPIKR